MTIPYEEDSHTSSITEFYHLRSKESGNSLGVFSLETKIEEQKSTFQGKLSTKANITIFVNFISNEYEYDPTHLSWFKACYHDLSNQGPRASISTHDPHNTGGIELKPVSIHGQRVGGLIMSKIITWLKTYPLDTVVNGIKFKPGGNEEAIAKFYHHAGIPTDGSTTTIKKLKVNESWKHNISKFTLSEFQSKIHELHEQIYFYKKQYDVLESQYSALSTNVNTMNPFKAMVSHSADPELIDKTSVPYLEQPVTLQLDQLALMKQYVNTQREFDKCRLKIQDKLNGIQSINETQRPERKLHNFYQASLHLANYYQKYFFIFGIIFIGISLFFFPNLRFVYTGMALLGAGLILFRLFNT